MKKRLTLTIIALLSFYNFVVSQDSFSLNLDSLISNKAIYPSTQISFKSGDDSAWAAFNLDVSDWEKCNTQILQDDSIEWNGLGWFRMIINVDSNLVGKPVGIYLFNTGELKLYLNGELKFDIDKMERVPQIIIFEERGENLIAVRFSNSNWEELHSANSWAGFRIAFCDYNAAIKNKINNDRFNLIEESIFIISALLLALMHTFIFIFDRRTKQNLYYVLFLLSFSAYIFILYYFKYSLEQLTLAFLNRFMVLLLNYILLFGVLTIFKISNFKQKFTMWFLATATLLGLIGFIFPGESSIYYISYIFIIFVSIRAGVALTRKENIGNNVKIIRVGFIFLSLSGIYQILISFGIVGPLFGSYNIFLFGVLIFLLSMSIGLAKEFVDNRKNLENQLSHVKELSAKTLDQELAAKELETEKKYLQIENERKSIELSDARNLQLSMLPKDIPNFDNLEISTYINTATEVGGDYYDIIPQTTSSQIVAIGDATGHGAKAGLMVAIMKSLFKSLGSNYLITDFFSKCNDIMKDMKLGNLFMSLSMLRINGNYVILSSAGMPVTLVYRSALNKIETSLFKSMPLGAFRDFPYERKELELEAGDVIFVFSDGLSELFNNEKEMFGVDNIEKTLLDLGKKSSDEIITGFIKNIDKWLDGKLPEDDITLMAIKFK